jgi:hypothetical protein
MPVEGIILLLVEMRKVLLALEIWLMVWLIKLRNEAVDIDDFKLAVVDNDRLLNRSDLRNRLREADIGGLGSKGFLIVG